MSNYYKVNYCIVCKKVDDKLSYHTFPKNANIRAKWLKILNLAAEDIHNRSIICSKHFDVSCYSKTALSSPRLMPGSLPNQQPYVSCKWNDYMDSQDICDMKIDIQNISSIVDVATTASIQDDIINSTDVMLSQNVVQSFKEREQIKTLKKRATRNKACTSRKVRYAGDPIPERYFSTPKEGHENFDFIHSKLAQKDRQIKTLKQANQRLQKKIARLEEFIKHLQNKNFMHHEVDNIL